VGSTTYRAPGRVGRVAFHRERTCSDDSYGAKDLRVKPRLRVLGKKRTLRQSITKNFATEGRKTENKRGRGADGAQFNQDRPSSREREEILDDSLGRSFHGGRTQASALSDSPMPQMIRPSRSVRGRTQAVQVVQTRRTTTNGGATITGGRYRGSDWGR